MPDIFDYCDSRLYLKNYYNERKRIQPSFSYQYFANKVELKSKSFAYRLITGQKKLSKSTVFAVARAIGLNKHETEYFEAMVNLTQEKSPMEREFYFNHLQSYGKAHPAVQLRQHQFDYYSRWYLSALREVVVYFDFKNDYKLLARTLDPPITSTQAKNGVRQLLALGLVEQLLSGRYRQTEASITTRNTIRSLAIQTFQIESLRLATESLTRHERHGSRR